MGGTSVLYTKDTAEKREETVRAHTVYLKYSKLIDQLESEEVYI